MRTELTRDEYLKANGRPKRRFRVMALTSSHVALSKPLPAPSYWFERNDVAQDGETGKYWRDTGLGIVSLVVDGKHSAFFYLAGKKLDTCTFAYDLNPAQLAAAVAVMRRAKLGHLIRPAAEWALREMPARRRPVLEPALQALVSRGLRS